MTAGIDISVGPLSGLVVVIASFFLVEGKSTPIVDPRPGRSCSPPPLATGLINGLMVRLGRFTAVAATLVTYIGLQGISLLLRPFQGGYISATHHRRDPDRPSARSRSPSSSRSRSHWAWSTACASRAGAWRCARPARASRRRTASACASNRTIIGAYVACSALTFLGGLMLMAQIGVGDPTQGVTYTLASITAVVLGGASLFGGRGSFIGTCSARRCCRRRSTPRPSSASRRPGSTGSRACSCWWPPSPTRWRAGAGGWR